MLLSAHGGLQRYASAIAGSGASVQLPVAPSHSLPYSRIESMRSYGTEWLGADGSCGETPETVVAVA